MSALRLATAMRRLELDENWQSAEDDEEIAPIIRTGRSFARRVADLVHAVRTQNDLHHHGSPSEADFRLSEELKKVSPVKLETNTNRVAPSVVLQEWEGYVTRINEDAFEAILVDVGQPGEIESKIAEIPLDELDDRDRLNLKEGSVFRWQISLERKPSLRRISQIVFRHLPAWTVKEIARAKDEARNLADQLSVLAKRTSEKTKS